MTLHAVHVQIFKKAFLAFLISGFLFKTKSETPENNKYLQYENKIIKQISNNEVNERKNITDSRPPCTSLQHWARRPYKALGPPGIPRP